MNRKTVDNVIKDYRNRIRGLDEQLQCLFVENTDHKTTIKDLENQVQGYKFKNLICDPIYKEDALKELYNKCFPEISELKEQLKQTKIELSEILVDKKESDEIKRKDAYIKVLSSKINDMKLEVARKVKADSEETLQDALCKRYVDSGRYARDKMAEVMYSGPELPSEVESLLKKAGAKLKEFVGGKEIKDCSTCRVTGCVNHGSDKNIDVSNCWEA